LIAERRGPMAKAAFIAKLWTATQDDRPARYSIRASSTKLDAGCQPLPKRVAHAVDWRRPSARAMARPLPLVEPVTMALRVLRGHVSARGLQERRPGKLLHRHATVARRKDEPKPEYAA